MSLQFADVLRAAQLQGRGLSCNEVAAEMGVTPHMLRKTLNAWGLQFDTPAGGARIVPVKVQPAPLVNIDAAADARGIDREVLTERLIASAASTLSLLDNILDDGTTTLRGA